MFGLSGITPGNVKWDLTFPSRCSHKCQNLWRHLPFLGQVVMALWRCVCFCAREPRPHHQASKGCNWAAIHHVQLHLVPPLQGNSFSVLSQEGPLCDITSPSLPRPQPLYFSVAVPSATGHVAPFGPEAPIPWKIQMVREVIRNTNKMSPLLSGAVGWQSSEI